MSRLCRGLKSVGGHTLSAGLRHAAKFVSPLLWLESYVDSDFPRFVADNVFRALLRLDPGAPGRLRVAANLQVHFNT